MRQASPEELIRLFREAVVRVLRGGSWNNNSRNARAANRNRNHPENRNNNIGFRVVLSRGVSTPRGRRPWSGLPPPARAARFTDRVGVQECESRPPSGVGPQRAGQIINRPVRTGRRKPTALTGLF